MICLKYRYAKNKSLPSVGTDGRLLLRIQLFLKKRNCVLGIFGQILTLSVYNGRLTNRRYILQSVHAYAFAETVAGDKLFWQQGNTHTCADQCPCGGKPHGFGCDIRYKLSSSADFFKLLPHFLVLTYNNKRQIATFVQRNRVLVRQN